MASCSMSAHAPSAVTTAPKPHLDAESKSSNAPPTPLIPPQPHHDGHKGQVSHAYSQADIDTSPQKPRPLSSGWNYIKPPTLTLTATKVRLSRSYALCTSLNPPRPSSCSST